MATPAIENLIAQMNPKEVTLVGSFVSIEALKKHPKVTRTFIDRTKEGNRLLRGYKLAKSIGAHEYAFSFRSHFFSKWLLFHTQTPTRHLFQNRTHEHQVLKYNRFINEALGIQHEAKALKLYYSQKRGDKELLGINAGASYGSAKRWYPKEFAKVANALSDRFDIVLFGSPAEVDIANDIQKHLTCSNYVNLAGKTDIATLIETIASLSLFITNDSGPMHVATAYQIPTIAIFGPTDYSETSPWKNPQAHIVSKNLACAPCKKRICPIKTHECMKSIHASDVLALVERIK